MTSKRKSRGLHRRHVVTGIAAGVGGAILSLGGTHARGADASDQKESGSAGPKERKMKSKGIYPETVKAADASYSPGILAEGTQVLFISGQGPKDPHADPETQIRQTLERIQTVLTTAGASWRNVVMIRSFFLDLQRDLPLFRKVRREFLVEPYPASTAVGTTALAIPGIQVEIEAVAIL